MHEFSVTQSLIQMIKDECLAENIERPKLVLCELGELTGYKAESILFYFDTMKQEIDQLAETTLDIKGVKGSMECGECGKISEIDNSFLIECKECGSVQVEIAQGKDFIIKEISP